MSDTITLTLNPTATAPIPAEPEAEAAKLDETILTPEEQQVVDEFAKQIDINDTNLVLQYGAAAQQKIAGFSEHALTSVRTKDLGEVGESLTELVVELKGFGAAEEKKGLFGLFKKAGNKLETMKAQFSTAEANVERSPGIWSSIRSR